MNTADRPILFSAPMVRALLAGTKTQTRRVAKGHITDASSIYAKLNGQPLIGCSAVLAQCPYGRPGDRLWVRETFGIGYDDSAGGHSAIQWAGADPQRDGKVFYLATFNERPDDGRLPWKPSIHMPRWASRITLEMVSVRVERLQDISEADATAEGVTDHHNITDSATGEIDREAVDAYQELWESINGPGTWDANPWVWCVEFKRVQP